MTGRALVIGLALLALAGQRAEGQDGSAGGRESAMARARLLAREHRTDQAREAYAAWLAGHPDDAAAWRELGREELRAGRPAAAAGALDRALALEDEPYARQRLRLAQALAAPAVEPVFGGSRDSDGNVISRAGVRADVAPADGARVGIIAEHSSLADGLDTGGGNAVTLSGRWRPRAALNLEGSAGVQQVESSARPLPTATFPTADFRFRYRAPGNGPRLDLRGRHDALALSPALIANRVVRSEVSAKLEVPAGPVWLRGMSRLGALSAGIETNYRSVFAGGVAVPVGGAAEVSGQFQRLSYSDPTTAGYFAPRLAQVLEAGTYAELEPASSWSLALDLGAGIQRAAEQGAPLGSWHSAFRLWATSSVALQPGRDLVLEVEAYDAPLATVAAVTSASWRWGSASLSLRWAM